MEENRLFHFIKNGLENHGAIVYKSAEDLIETLIPHDLAENMGLREDQQFSLGSACQNNLGVENISYNSETLGKFSILIDNAGFFSSLGSKDLYLKQKGLEKTVSKKISFLNSSQRYLQKREIHNSYLMFNFKYTAISEEKQEGILPVLINEHTLASLPDPKEFKAALEENLQPILSTEDIPISLLESQPLNLVSQRACGVAKVRIRKILADFERSLSIRMKRDIERLTEYYQMIIRQIEKKIQKRQLTAEDKEKEKSRIKATQLELKKKIHGQRKRYSLKIQVDLINVLRIFIPVICLEYEVYRKKAKKNLTLIWNPLMKDLELPTCECCFNDAGGFFLCDEHQHLLCAKCYGACISCQKQYCRICYPQKCPRCSSPSP
jgi:hypothetical protein